jgi:hypothetical protein
MPRRIGIFSSIASLARRHLGLHALLELHPQPRHREEHRRAGALQVGGEGLQALGEEHMHAGGQQAMLDQHALGHVRQRQVAQHAPVLVHAARASGPR